MNDECPEAPGGFSKPEPANQQIQKIVDEVKPKLEEKENVTYEVFVALEFRTQIVGGGERNYLIKVSVSDSSDECVHLEVNENEVFKFRYQTGKTISDVLTCFK